MRAWQGGVAIVAAMALFAGATGCSSAHRAQAAAYEAGNRGEFAARTLARADATPAEPDSATAEETPWREAIADLRARAESWQRRDAEGGAFAGFQALAGESVAARRAELADPERAERALIDGAPLPELWLLAVARNPGVRAAHQKWRSTLEMYEQAGYLENLLLQYRAFTRTLETGLGEEMHKGMVQEAFPFPATVALKGELADREAAMAWEEYRKEIRDVLVAIGDAHHLLEYLERAIAVTRESRDLLAQMEKVAQTRYQAGATGQIDVLRIQSELSKRDNDLTTFEQERVTALARVNSLLSRPPSAPLGPVRPYDLADPKPSLEDVQAAALRCRQELAIARLELEIAERGIRLAETMVYPRASQGFSLAQTGQGLDAGPDRAEAVFPERPMPEPRFGFGRDAAYLDQLRHEREARRAEVAALEDRVRFEAKELHFGIDTARRKVTLFDSALVPQAEQALGASRSGYETGKFSFLDFIDAQRTYLEARLDQEEARGDLRRAINRLLEVVGCNAAG